MQCDVINKQRCDGHPFGLVGGPGSKTIAGWSRSSDGDGTGPSFRNVIRKRPRQSNHANQTDATH